MAVPMHTQEVAGNFFFLPPCSVEELDLGEPLADHGGEEEPQQHAADEHVVIVVLQHVELFGRVHARLEEVQPIGHHL